MTRKDESEREGWRLPVALELGVRAPYIVCSGCASRWMESAPLRIRSMKMIDLSRYWRLLIGLLAVVLSGVIMANTESLQAGLDRIIGPKPQCSWPATHGSIAGSDLQNHVRANGEDDWKFSVRFTHAVNGAQYAGEQQLSQYLVVPPDVPKFAQVPYLFTACSSLRDMTETVALFRAAHDKSGFFRDQPVVVYYNPADNDEAVLVPGLIFDGPLSYGEAIVAFASMIPCLVGLFLVFTGLGALRKPRRASVPSTVFSAGASMRPPNSQLQIAPLSDARKQEVANVSCAVCVALGGMVALGVLASLGNSQAVISTVVPGILVSVGLVVLGFRLRRRS